MTTTREATRTPRRQPLVAPPSLRVVCLTGDPSRRYRHATPGDPAPRGSKAACLPPPSHRERGWG